MSATILDGVSGLGARVGQDLGHSDWLEITQDRVDTFARAIGDRRWSQVDGERAAHEADGVTVAHEFLTLSLAPALMPKVVRVAGFRFAVNYGCNTLRFLSPVPVGSSVRLGVVLAAVDEIAGGVQTTFRLCFETNGSPKPCCVVEAIFRYFA